MTGSLRHRGPDGNGLWIDETAGVALGHRRLAIVDLSEAGSQPMVSTCGRYIVSYNGEIYNADELRERLRKCGDSFRGSSDTEVLVAAIARWGVIRTLSEIIGIFAFAAWDKQTRELRLVRDQLGVKPLFWSNDRGCFLFASELRALAALPEFDHTLDPAAVGCFLQYNYIRSPLTIYRSARSLEPGSTLLLKADGSITIERYWSLIDVVMRHRDERLVTTDPQAALTALEMLLTDAVSRQLVSDVPIGAFLSGGVDSSTVVALMRNASTSPVRTFSIGFDVDSFDEAPAARGVAAHLGTEHTEFYVTGQEAVDCVPKLPAIYDQPLADTSGVPTYLLCELAHKQVSVALTGDGGDELFFGYQRYFKACAVHERVRGLPAPARKLASAIVEGLGGKGMRRNGFAVPGRIPRTAWHLSRLSDYASRDLNDIYLHFVTNWQDPGVVAPSARMRLASWNEHKECSPELGEQMMVHDSLTYLTDGVLAKVDRASMANSIEARVPLLDHRVVEHAWSLPFSLKYHDGVGKWALRQILYKHVPREIVDRPKRGFGSPVGMWLRGPLRDWASQLLSEKCLLKHGVLDVGACTRLWKVHLDGAVNVSSYLWALLMLQAWLEEMPGPQPQQHISPIRAG